MLGPRSYWNVLAYTIIYAILPVPSRIAEAAQRSPAQALGRRAKTVKARSVGMIDLFTAFFPRRP